MASEREPSFPITKIVSESGMEIGETNIDPKHVHNPSLLVGTYSIDLKAAWNKELGDRLNVEHALEMLKRQMEKRYLQGTQ